MKPGRRTSLWCLSIATCMLAWAAPSHRRRRRAGSSPRTSRPQRRGNEALTQHSYLKAEWSIDAYKKAAKLWGEPAPDPDKDPDGYARAFARHYGLHPAPYPNDGLPMGLRWSRKPDGTKTGIQIDCMVCHGGSIGGQSYVGLGNTQLDLRRCSSSDLIRADGRRVAARRRSRSARRGARPTPA